MEHGRELWESVIELYLIMSGSLLLFATSVYNYYLKRVAAREGKDLEKELSRLKQKESISPEELPAIGSSQEIKRDHLILFGYFLSVLLLTAGFLANLGVI